MKRVIAMSLVLLTIVFTLWGGSQKDTGASAEAAGKKPVKLSMWVWDDNQVPATQAMLNAFMKKYPWITVELTCIPGATTEYNIKMSSVLGTKDAPNVFWNFYTFTKEYHASGYIQELNSFIEKDKSFNINALNKGVTETYTFNGKIYGIAKDLDPSVCFYNKALFDEAGVPYPKDGWTMQEFADTAKKLTGGGVKGWTNTASDRMWYAFIWGNGGEIYSPDGMESIVTSPEAVEAAQNYLDIMNKGYALTGTELTELGSANAFMSGICAMTIDGTWTISQFAEALGDKLGIAEIPGGKKGKATTINGLAYSTTTQNPYMEETWLLLSYLGSAEAQIMQAEVVIPAENSVTGEWADVYPNLNVQPIIKSLSYARHIPLAEKNPSKTRNTVSEYLAEIRNGKYPNAKAGLEAMKKAMDASIKN
jgi:multiple sugar transport system substrate-binding protein